MYLRTRLLLGIAVVTLVALAISIVVPLTSVRDEVSLETESSTQVAVLMLAIENSIDDAPDLAAARAGAAEKIRRSEPLRHIKMDLLDTTGKVLAKSPIDEPQGGRLARMLLPSETNVTLRYELEYHGESLGQLRLLSNPLSEIAEIEKNTFRDLELLAHGKQRALLQIKISDGDRGFEVVQCDQFLDLVRFRGAGARRA